jgi:ubiquinone/menaquinone biosynthesis C-methylase UbiE
MKKVDYDQVVDVYDYRYQRSYRPDGLSEKLRHISETSDMKTVLEVGCGTGHWLGVFPDNVWVVGLDAALGMLCKAHLKNLHWNLIQGSSDSLPVKENGFDLIYCINAIHHFKNPYGFIKACKSLLRHNGILVIVGMDPHIGSDKWFI